MAQCWPAAYQPALAQLQVDWVFVDYESAQLIGNQLGKPHDHTTLPDLRLSDLDNSQRHTGGHERDVERVNKWGKTPNNA